jgi:hypothetical protein
MRFPLVALPLLAAALPARAAEVPDFNRDVRPILSNNCFLCHGPDEDGRKGGQKGLRLDTREGALEDLGGGAFAIVPGNPDQSELLKRLVATDAEELMPPAKTGKSLTAAEVDVLRRWIAGGAPYARHWSYEPPVRPEPPAVVDAAWPRGPVDRFILARLERAGLRPQPEAGRHTLARRVALDLTGLPPTPEEVEAFVADAAPGAYERYVDRQLAKPAYGEHWARGWLDLARYADSKGYADDQPRSIWPYRDWVIDAFNANLPFDRFTLEQIAGDLLPNSTQAQLFATGFHRNTMNNTEGGTDDEEFRSVAVVDRVNTTMAVWMGTSMACAQCHTHKYDPISIRDYFRMYAILNQTEDADRNDESPVLEFLSSSQQRQRDDWEAEAARLDARFAAARDAHADAARRWAGAFPASPVWISPRPAEARSAADAVVTIDEEGRVKVAPGQAKDTTAVEIPAPAGEAFTAFRIESLPASDLPGGGAGGAGGNFVVTRVRAAVRPPEPHRNARFIRVELPGKGRVLSLAEVEVFSGGRNVAASGAPSQSSVAGGAGPARAIDGRKDGDPAAATLIQTDAGDDPWWELDLGVELPVERVVLWARLGEEATPGGLRVTALDAARKSVHEATLREAPRPSLTFDLGAPRELPLLRAAADFVQAGYDASLVISDAEPKRPAKGAKAPPRKGWAVGGAKQAAHVLIVQPREAFTLAPGERLVVTIEQQSTVAKATLNHFRVGLTREPRIGEIVRTPALELALLGRAEAERTAEENARLLEHYVREVAPELAAERRRLATLRQQIADQAFTTTPIMRELPPDRRRKTHVQLRGNHLALGDEVEPGVPSAFPPLPAGVAADRLALARWLTDPANPLTARVLVNRLWESVFGIGLVRTSEEFGSQGELPSHPELLDWLATEMVAGGWDQKRFLRLLVTSAAYRQSSRVTPEALAADSDNRLLSRGPRHRASAEVVRDQTLAASGLLSTKLHGPPARPYQPAFDLKAAFGGALDWKTSEGEDRYRRGLYTEWRRSSPYPSMVTFDAPNREVCTLRRNRTNTPLQALVTMNDPVYVEAAQALARLIGHGPDSVEEKIKNGLRRVLLRPVAVEEIAPVAALYRSSLAAYAREPELAAAMIANPANPPPATFAPAELAAWTAVANVLLNLDEFLMKP